MGFLADDFLLGIFLCKDFHCFEGTYLSFLIPSYPLSSCIQFLRWYLHTSFHTFRLVLCWARFCVWNLGFVESNFLTNPSWASRFWWCAPLISATSPRSSKGFPIVSSRQLLMSSFVCRLHQSGRAFGPLLFHVDIHVV